MTLLYAYGGFVAVTGALILVAGHLRRRWDRHHPRHRHPRPAE